jgi:hypothetical protein
MADETIITRGTDTNPYAERQARRLVKIERLKDAMVTITSERDQLRSERERLANENAILASRADTSLSAKKVQELEAKLREISHRKAFDRIAKERGVAEDALDLVYQTSGYKADQPEVDEVAIGAILDEQRTRPGVSRLFGQPAGTASPNGPQQPPPAPKPGPASGQGGPTQGRVPMAPDDPRHGDVKYVWENFDTISADAKGRIERGEI